MDNRTAQSYGKSYPTTAEYAKWKKFNSAHDAMRYAFEEFLEGNDRRALRGMARRDFNTAVKEIKDLMREVHNK